MSAALPENSKDHLVTIRSYVPPTKPMVLSPESAKRLSDWYLPVVLRDFFLGMHPLMQTYMYQKASQPAEFFSIVQMEAARHQQLRRYAWHDENETERRKSQKIELIPYVQELTKIGGGT